MKNPGAPRRAARFRSSTTHLKQKRRDSRLGGLKIGPKVGFWVCRKADALGGAHQCSAGPPDGTERCRNLPQVLNHLRCHHHHLHHERGLDGLLCTVWTADIRARRGYPVKFTYCSTVVLRYLTVWVYRYLHGIVCCTAVPTITGSEHGCLGYGWPYYGKI